jgi:thymidylate synthase
MDRTGVGTLSSFNHNVEFDLDDGFPLLTTKKIHYKNVLVELLFFLTGQTNNSYLLKHDCKIWSNWADKNGDLHKIYSHQWRNVNDGYYGHTVDQIAEVINILQNDPNSRRAIVDSWNPLDLDDMALPPCHFAFVFNVQYSDGEPRLCLHWTQRSADCALGIPYNFASYATLLHIIGRIVNIRPWKLACTLIDAHIYSNHIDGLKKQLLREPRKLPELTIDPNLKTLEDFEHLAFNGTTQEIVDAFKLEGYDPHPFIKFEVAV